MSHSGAIIRENREPRLGMNELYVYFEFCYSAN